MEGKRVVDALKMMKEKEISDNAAPPQAYDSGMFQSLKLACWGPGRKNVGKDELTIFYGGKVSVFESIPADKAREIMLMAVAAAATSNNVVTTTNYNPSSSMQTTANANFNPLSKLKLAAELPITRTYSLQRFLEKRRDRLVNKGPYSTNKTAEGKGANNHTHTDTALPEAA